MSHEVGELWSNDFEKEISEKHENFIKKKYFMNKAFLDYCDEWKQIIKTIMKAKSIFVNKRLCDAINSREILEKIIFHNTLFTQNIFSFLSSHS
jgi:hypothetical protein